VTPVAPQAGGRRGSRQPARVRSGREDAAPQPGCAHRV